MSSPFLQPTSTKPTTYPRGGVSSPPAKSSPKPPSESGQSPINLGPGTSNNDAKVIAERRRAKQSVTSARSLARFDSISQDSKAILDGMAGMFSPEKDELETPEISPFKIEMEVPPVVFPVKEKRGKDPRDDQMRQRQARRKKAHPYRVRRPTRTPLDPIPEEGNET